MIQIAFEKRAERNDASTARQMQSWHWKRRGENPRSSDRAPPTAQARCLRRAANSPQSRLHLQECIGGEDGQRLLEACNLLLSLGFLVRVTHHLRLALGLQLVQIRKNRVELLRRRGLIFFVVAERNFDLLHFARLPLDVASLRRFGDRVLLRELVVRLLRRRLVGLGLREQRREVRLRDLQDRHDRGADVALGAAELRLLRADLHEGRAVVLAQHVDRLRHGGRGVLEVLRRLQVLLVLLLTDLGRLRLASVHLRDFGLEHLDLLEKLGLPRFGLGDARADLVELAGEVRLLRLRLARLLVAEGLLVRLLGSLVRELGDHLLDEAADLAERIAARLRRKLRQGVAVLRPRQFLQDAHDLRARVEGGLRLRLQASAGGGLQEHLNALRQNILRLLDRRGLLAGLLLPSRPFGRLQRAALLQLLQILRVSGQRLLGLGERSFRAVELLLGRRPRQRRLRKLLVRNLDLIFET